MQNFQAPEDLHGVVSFGNSNFGHAGPPDLLWSWNPREMICGTWIAWKDYGTSSTTLKEMQDVLRNGNYGMRVQHLSVELLHLRAPARVMPLLERVGQLDRLALQRYRPGYSREYLHRPRMSDHG